MQSVIPRTQKNPNPQGKGCAPVLQDLGALRPRLPESKTAHAILEDYCLSALVLASHFRFRPVPGKPYYLYSGDGGWSLSLIGPGEWGDTAPGEFVATCHLRSDMTWELAFCPLHVDSPVRQRLSNFVEGFTSALSGQESVMDELPFYVDDLPYYQRMLATGLAVSLQHSISETGTAALAKALPTLLPERL